MSSEGWKELMGKDIQFKRIVEAVGENAAMGTIVDCTLTGFLLSGEGTVSSIPFESLRVIVQIGEGDLVPGLELPLRHSKSGETLRAKFASKFAYGTSGRKASDKDKVAEIPANADLEYEVKVNGHYDNAASAAGLVNAHDGEGGDRKWSHELAVHDITLRKECGNRWFSYGDYPKATKAYAKGVQSAEGYLNSFAGAGAGVGVEESSDDFNDDSVTNLYIMCLNNLAACHFLKGDTAKAKELCVRVLEIDPDNVKALLRAARVSLSMDDYDSCEGCLQKLLVLDPTNDAAVKEMAKLKRAKANYKAKQKVMSKSMARHLFKGGNSSCGSSSSETKTSSNDTANWSQTQEDTNSKNKEDGDASAGGGDDGTVGNTVQVQQQEELDTSVAVKSSLSPAPTASSSNVVKTETPDVLTQGAERPSGVVTQGAADNKTTPDSDSTIALSSATPVRAASVLGGDVNTKNSTSKVTQGTRDTNNTAAAAATPATEVAPANKQQKDTSSGSGNSAFLLLAANVIVLLLSLAVALYLQSRYSPSKE